MATKRRNLPEPAERCLRCGERAILERYVRKYFGGLTRAPQLWFYLLCVSWMEWRVHAAPGDWIVVSSRTWANNSFCGESMVHNAFLGLERVGLIEYERGRFPDKMMRIRRKTIGELKLFVERRKLVARTEHESKKDTHGHVGRVPVYANMKARAYGDDDGMPKGSIVKRMRDLVGGG